MCRITFVCLTWLVSMKMKSVPSSFIISSILLISAAIDLAYVDENGDKYPTVSQSKSGFEAIW